MTDQANVTGVSKIELMVNEDAQFFDTNEPAQNSRVKKKIRFRHFLWLPSYFFKKLYFVSPKLLKDILFCISVIHKAPSSKFFAKTRYDELRTTLDVKISKLVILAAPVHIRDKLRVMFDRGCHAENIGDLSALNDVIQDVVSYARPSHAGARPYYKDGKNHLIESSFSAYFSFSSKDNQIINSHLIENLSDDFDYYLSVLAGYPCKLKDLTHALSVVHGANSNDEMHQDTYASVAKGFLYLQNIDENQAPFEYLAGSFTDAIYRSYQTNKAVLEGDAHSSGSTRLRAADLRSALEKYELISFTGPAGQFIIANTAGYHRKGLHKSSKPRIILTCGVARKGMASKLLMNLIAIFNRKLIRVS